MQELIKKIYDIEENIWVEDIHPNGTKCYIFFSSNGLYQNINEDEIYDRIVCNNRYEWKSMASAFKYHKDLARIIYVRDVYVAFYIYGINKKINSIDKVIERIAELSKGYDITTAGVSSGGYLATICAIRLKGKRAFCFSGQFDIWDRITETDRQYCRDTYGNYKYMNISTLIQDNCNIPIYYFCPIGCDHDFANYQLVKDIRNVHCFLFPDKKHAATVYPFNFPDLLFVSNQKIERLSVRYKGQTINKKYFYLRTVTVRGLLTLINYLKKSEYSISKLKKKWDI